jgi:hypothetical protein
VVGKGDTNKSQSQNQPCLHVRGSMRSTPTSDIEVLLMVLPRNNFIEKESKGLVGHSLILTRVTEEKPLSNFPSRTDWVDPDSLLPPNSVTFYIDGSFFNGWAGPVYPD